MRSALDSGSGGPGSSPGEVTTTGSSTDWPHGPGLGPGVREFESLLSD
jgi:hypothetical protein